MGVSNATLEVAANVLCRFPEEAIHYVLMEVLF